MTLPAKSPSSYSPGSTDENATYLENENDEEPIQEGLKEENKKESEEEIEEEIEEESEQRSLYWLSKLTLPAKSPSSCSPRNTDEIDEENEKEMEEEIEEEIEEESELAAPRNKKIKFTYECTKEVRVVDNKDKMEQVSELAAQSNTQKKYKGVRSRNRGRWSAEIGCGKSKHWLGTYTTAEEAAIAYDIARICMKGYEVLPQLNFPVVGTNDASKKSMMTLRSKDGVAFSVSKTVVAKQSKFLHKIIENPGLITYFGNSVTLPRFTKSTLENVIAYCTKHDVEASDMSETETAEEGSSSTTPANSRISVEELMKWDEQFVNGNAATLDDLNKAAEFLEIQGLQALLSSRES